MPTAAPSQEGRRPLNKIGRRVDCVPPDCGIVIPTNASLDVARLEGDRCVVCSGQVELKRSRRGAGVVGVRWG